MAWDMLNYVAGSDLGWGYAQICSGISSWLGICSNMERDQFMAWDMGLKYVAGSAHGLGYAQICSEINSWLGIYSNM